MKGRRSSLLTEIEHDLINGLPVADVLRKLIILGGRAGSSELRAWASQELQGYGSFAVEDLPGYRRVQASIQLDGSIFGGRVKHQPVAPSQLPEQAQRHINNTVAFFQGVGELQAMVETAGESRTIRILLPNERLLSRLIDDASGDPYQQTDAIYWAVSVSAVAGILDQIKTKLAEILAEMRALTPMQEDVPTPESVARAVSVVVTGRGNKVSVDAGVAANAPKSGSADIPDAKFWTVSKALLGAAVGLATLASVVIAYLQLQISS
ncbi:hypothetical protein [Clavibacter zhangzhiyongii]|uniref:AbiTii domain-containing protein n=1 Tax=Clavibacter TaxID=1573 RepID=UPI0039E19B88